MNFEIFLVILFFVLIFMYFFIFRENFGMNASCGQNYHDKGTNFLSCPRECPKMIKMPGRTDCVKEDDETKNKTREDEYKIDGVCGDNKHAFNYTVNCPDECKFRKTYPGGTMCNKSLEPLQKK